MINHYIILAGYLIALFANSLNNSLLVLTVSKAGRYSIEIADLSGKVLQQKNGNTMQGENKISLDVSSYATGMYLINVSDDEHGKRVLKLTKQ